MKQRAACLFLLFNRPDKTAQVFEAIRLARPGRLYLAGDGPRKDVAGEDDKVARARAIVCKIDWDCEVHTLFRDQNLGCKEAVGSAISWFFEQEDAGIILEDDCLPTQDFFLFCEELLERYRHDTRIMAISGNNLQEKRWPSQKDDSYYFSRYPHNWGWATWKRAWKYWDAGLISWPETQERNLLCHALCDNQAAASFWAKIFARCYAGAIDTWDYQWTYACFIQSGLTIIPHVNLVSNIGFDSEATHTKDAASQYSKIPAHPLQFPLRHPACVVRNLEADQYTDQYVFKIRTACSPPSPSIVSLCKRKLFGRLH